MGRVLIRGFSEHQRTGTGKGEGASGIASFKFTMEQRHTSAGGRKGSLFHVKGSWLSFSCSHWNSGLVCLPWFPAAGALLSLSPASPCSCCSLAASMMALENSRMDPFPAENPLSSALPAIVSAAYRPGVPALCPS